MCNSLTTIAQGGNIMELVKVKTKDGYVELPSTMIQLNTEEAGNCNEAVIVECRNSDEYDISRFIYFCSDDFLTKSEYEQKEIIIAACDNASEQFRVGTADRENWTPDQLDKPLVGMFRALHEEEVSPLTDWPILIKKERD